MNPPSTGKGVTACLAGALLWASNGVVSKYLMMGGLCPFVLAQGRLSFAAVLAFLWLLLARPSALRIRPKDLPGLLLLGTVGMAGVNACYLSAIASIPTAAAILLEYLAPALIALYAWRFMQEQMGVMKLLALLLALAGCFLVVGGYNLDLLTLNLRGVLWGLGAALTFAFYCIYSEYGLRFYSPWTVLCYALVISAVTWNLVLGPGHLLLLGWDAPSWSLVFYSASLGTVVPFGLFAFGIEHLRATRATIISTFEPIAAALIAYLWLGETLEPLQMLGGLAVLAAVVLIQNQREQDRFSPAMIKREQLRPL